MNTRFRRPPSDGERIDRTRSLVFTFDDRTYSAFAGDTLASALLAAGVRTVGLSIYRHRPRGIVSAGSAGPDPSVSVESDLGAAPMLRITDVDVRDGVRARSLRGMGRLPVTAPEADSARYDKLYAHCDVLVVGAGPAGLAAAAAAGSGGARVVLLEEDSEPGGYLLGSRETLDDAPAMDWVRTVRGQLAELPEVRVLTRTTALGYYDHNYVVAVERRDHPPGERLWRIRAREIVLATGAHERPIVFTDNDRPGIMLAGAARTYVNRYGVRSGQRAVLFTAADSAYAAALDLLDAGIDVPAIVDVRPEPRDPEAPWPTLLRWRGVEVLRYHAVTGTDGPDEVHTVRVAHREGGRTRVIGCDLLAVCGGWNPAVQLFSQARGPLRYDESLAAFVPASDRPGRSAGAARGVYETAAAIADGYAGGAAAAFDAGFAAPPNPTRPSSRSRPQEASAAYWAVPPAASDEAERQFVDLERDVTVADLHHAVGAGLRSVEHIKRYTTMGTASDQGKTSSIVGVGVVAELLGQRPEVVGTTTYRPPYQPVSFAALAGRDRGALADPERITALHHVHVAAGAVFEDVGQWKRPWYFPRPGEDLAATVRRECRAARTGVAIMDASTLGKIDIRGPDAAEFLDRIYTNRISSLKVGSCRYGMMCSADGMVFDDGVVARLADDHFVSTTTTGNAAAVLDWLEEWLQTEWPDLKVFCTSVTDHWATIAIVGPRSRDVVAPLAPELDLHPEAFPFMTVRATTLAIDSMPVPARVFRVSFSGELAYEINVAAWHAVPVWRAALAAGRQFDITPYGTETMHVLRAEKGYVIVGQDTDGTVTPQDLGMSWVVSAKKADFVGRRSHQRTDTARADRKCLIGLLPDDPAEVLPEGAQLVREPGSPPLPMVGHVTSSYFSAALERSFALALVREPTMGARLYAPLADRTVAVTITEPVFYDKEGSRRDG